MGSFFLVALAIPRLARAGLGRRCKRRRLGGLGLVPGRVRRALHAALHDLPDPPRRALGRRLHRPEVLARPARRGPRRRAVAVLQRRAGHDRVAGADPRRDRRGRAVAPRSRSSPPSWSGTSSSRWPSTRGRARSSPGSSCTRCCRWSCSPAPASQAIWQTRGALRWRRARRRGDRAALRRRRLVVGQRRPRRRPARDARLHPVLDARSRRSPTRCSRWPTSRGPGTPPLTVTVDSAEGATFPYAWYFRHLRDRLHRPPAGQRRAARRRRGRDDRREPTRGCSPRWPTTTAASSTSASGGCASTARSRPGNLLPLHHPAQGLEPHRRDEGMALRQEGALVELPDLVPVVRSTTLRPSWSHLARPASP